MKINTSAKGRTKEKACADALERDGWTIEFRSIRTKFQRIDLGYRPTKEEREVCVCGHPKEEHDDKSGKCFGHQDRHPTVAELFGKATVWCLCHKFRMKKLTGWKAAKFDVEAIKDGVIIRVSVKNFGSNTGYSLMQMTDDIKDYRDHHKLPACIKTALWIWHGDRWRGRGKDKHFEEAKWEKLVIT